MQDAKFWEKNKRKKKQNKTKRIALRISLVLWSWRPILKAAWMFIETTGF